MHRRHPAVVLALVLPLVSSLPHASAQSTRAQAPRRAPGEGVARLPQNVPAAGVARVPARRLPASSADEGVARLGHALRTNRSPQSDEAVVNLRSRTATPTRRTPQVARSAEEWALPRVVPASGVEQKQTSGTTRLPLIRSSKPRTRELPVRKVTTRRPTHRAPIGRVPAPSGPVKKVVKTTPTPASTRKPVTTGTTKVVAAPARLPVVRRKKTVTAPPVPKTLSDKKLEKSTAATKKTVATATAEKSQVPAKKIVVRRTAPSQTPPAIPTAPKTLAVKRPAKTVSSVTKKAAMPAKSTATVNAGTKAAKMSQARSREPLTIPPATKTVATTGTKSQKAVKDSKPVSEPKTSTTEPSPVTVGLAVPRLSRPNVVFRPERHWLGLKAPEVREPVYLQDLEALLKRSGKQKTPTRTVSSQTEATQSDCEKSDLGAMFRPIGETVAYDEQVRGMPGPEDCASSLLAGAAVPSHYNTKVPGGPPRPDRHVHAFCHNPLYYEDLNLERCGSGHYCAQTAVSAVRFFGTAAIMPYLMTLDPPNSCVEATQDCPTCYEFPHEDTKPRWSWGAAAVQAAATTGMFFIIP